MIPLVIFCTKCKKYTIFNTPEFNPNTWKCTKCEQKKEKQPKVTICKA